MEVSLAETEARLLRKLFSSHARSRLLVLGDFMVDEYIRGAVNKISPEAPVQVIEVCNKDRHLGGAGNVVNNLLSMGASVSACGVIGEDSDGRWLIDELLEKGAAVDGLFLSSQRPTSLKQRVIAGNQQMLRLDFEVKYHIDKKFEDRIIGYISDNIALYDLIIISDYKKGVLSPRVLRETIALSRKHKKPVIIDPKGTDYSNYRGATLITPNKKEASLATGIDIVDQESLLEAGHTLLRELQLTALLITRGEEGMSLFQPGMGGDSVGLFHAPTKAREVFDITGAGDTVLSTLGLCLASDIPLKESVELANVAGGISVGKLGTATVTVKEVIHELEGYEITGYRKLKDPGEALDIVKQHKKLGKRVVLTMGCFEMLRLDQIRFLSQARRLGDCLIVGVYSDKLLAKHFGDEHPYIHESERTQIIAAIDSVDYLILLDNDEPNSLIRVLEPNIVAESNDSIRLDKEEIEELESSFVKVVGF